LLLAFSIASGLFGMASARALQSIWNRRGCTTPS
jgi:hypothetical protein